MKKPETLSFIAWSSEPNFDGEPKQDIYLPSTLFFKHINWAVNLLWSRKHEI